MHRIISFSIILIFAIFSLFLMSKYIASSGVVPAFSEYMASSTQKIANVAGPAEKYEYSIPLKTPLMDIYVLVASSTEAMTKGLGGRNSLSSDFGMLFFFSSPGKTGFWMDDMHFPIDMVWIDSSRKVVGIEKNVSPDSYPEVYFPPKPILYVLELNAGKAEEFGIATGTVLFF